MYLSFVFGVGSQATQIEALAHWFTPKKHQPCQSGNFCCFFCNLACNPDLTGLQPMCQPSGNCPQFLESLVRRVSYEVFGTRVRATGTRRKTGSTGLTTTLGDRLLRPCEEHRLHRRIPAFRCRGQPCPPGRESGPFPSHPRPRQSAHPEHTSGRGRSTPASRSAAM